MTGMGAREWGITGVGGLWLEGDGDSSSHCDCS